MTIERTYSTRRLGIINALVDVIKKVDGTGDYYSDLRGNVYPRLKFWDEIEDFPAVHLNAGSEARVYQAGGYKDRYLTVTVRVYVNEEDAVDALARLLEDIETVLEENSGMLYHDRRGDQQQIHQISIVSIDTDEGVLEPLGVGEITLEVRY